jgi:hypothetical protein
MSVAAFELAGAAHSRELRSAADVLVRVLSDDGAPRAARRDAGEALRTHVAIDPTITEDALAAWWTAHRDAMVWHPSEHRFQP